MNSTTKQPGRLILITSGSGGTGKTSFAVNLAVTLAEKKIKTAFADADLPFGDASLLLNLLPAMSMKEAAERNDASNIEGYMERSASGVWLLAAPKRPEYAELVSSSFLLEAVEQLLSTHEAVIVDTQSGLQELIIPLMERADHIFAVTMPGLASIKNTKLLIETIEALQMKEKVQLLLNKTSRHALVAAKEVPALTGMQEVVTLPEDAKNLALSLDKGEPLAVHLPNSPYAKKIRKLAAQLFSSELQPEKNNAQQKNRFGKINKRWRGKHDEPARQTTVKESKRSSASY